MPRLLTLLMIVLMVFIGYRKRYRMLNTILSSQMLRQFAVRTFFNIPFVRDRLIRGIFPA
jgi:hypothetical protein